MISGGERGSATPTYFDRVDLVLMLALTVVAFVLRFSSPILPDFFLHPTSGPWITNCVTKTPVDPIGTQGTLCGLAYPFNRGYADANGQLSPPNGQVFDEVYFPVDAYNDVKGIQSCHPTTVGCQYNYIDPEPPLAKGLIAAGELAYGWYRATFEGAKGDYIDLGFNTFGWRIAACLFGTLCIPMMYLLARRMWPNRLFAIAAATLACFDGMFFIQSRIGMIDIFPIFFILLGYFLFFVHLQSRTFRGSLFSLSALGVVLGIGIAAKWIVLAAWASIGFFLLLRLVLAAFDVEWGPLKKSPVPPAIYVPVALVALVAVPAGIYLASWYPFFARGQFQSLSDLWNYQVWAYEYHKNLTATHPYGSPAWSWPLLARPVLYYAEYYPYFGLDHFTGQQLQARMIDLGNPWIWLTSLPCVVSLPYFVIRHRSFPAAVILLGFITQYAPWWPITRVLFMYHMFGGLVFMVLALAFVLVQLADRFPPPDRKVLVTIHLSIAIVFFGYFYPLWTAVPLSNPAYALTVGTPPWGPKLWFDLCPNPPPPPSKPQLFCWN